MKKFLKEMMVHTWDLDGLDVKEVEIPADAEILDIRSYPSGLVVYVVVPEKYRVVVLTRFYLVPVGAPVSEEALAGDRFGVVNAVIKGTTVPAFVFIEKYAASLLRRQARK